MGEQGVEGNGHNFESKSKNGPFRIKGYEPDDSGAREGRFWQV